MKLKLRHNTKEPCPHLAELGTGHSKMDRRAIRFLKKSIIYSLKLPING